MIDLSKVYEPKSENPFELIPDKTELLVYVDEFGEWKEKKVTVKNRETNTVKTDVSIANIKVTFVVDDPNNKKYNGRKISYNLTTHPNMYWIIPSFLNAVGADKMSLAEIPTKTLKSYCKAVIGIDSYDKKKVDKDTGIETTVETKYNCIRSLKPLDVDNDLNF